LKDPKYVKKIVGRIEEWKGKFIGNRISANIHRIAQSFAYNLVGFETFCRFMEESGFISVEKRVKMVKIHKNNLFVKIDKNVMDVKDATVSEVFINTLMDLINSGAVHIHHVGKDSFNPYDVRDECIGFDDDKDESDKKYVYFFGTSVWNAVNKAAGSGRGLMNSKKNLISELVKRGIMMPGTQGNTFNKELYGKTQATWKILKSALGYEKDDLLDAFAEGIEDDMEDW
jgi:hypothetical protein